MQGINFYLMPSKDYQSITVEDALNLQDLTDYLQKNEQLAVPNTFWEEKDRQELSASDFFFSEEQSDIADYLMETIAKLRQCDASYDTGSGYAVISQNDIPAEASSLFVYRATDLMHSHNDTSAAMHSDAHGRRESQFKKLRGLLKGNTCTLEAARNARLARI